jgi:hypothetical protein
MLYGMRKLILVAAILLLATPALAGDHHRRIDPGYANRHGTRSTYSGVVGGRAVSPGSYYSPRRYDHGYGYGSRYGRHSDTTVIIIERDRGYGRRWR